MTYFYFEYAVRHATSYVWDDLLDTGAHRLLVVPLCLALTLAYFGVQHLLDPKSEDHEAHGLGAAPDPTVTNFVKVLAIGFLSLLAGASLGPEAILVPASIMLGGYLGARLADRRKQTLQLFGMAGFMALFTAFFNSFFVGILSLLLVRKQSGIRITPGLIILAVAASGGSALMLAVLRSSAYVETPGYSWALNLRDLALFAVLAAAGYLVTYGLGAAHDLSQRVVRPIKGRSWWLHGLTAGAGLSVLYLAGGSLVQFTGNESVVPMFKQSADLGLWGLLWLAIIKVIAIGWSKAGGYRGGLVFPTAFVAAVAVAMARLYVHDVNLIYGLIAVMAGALYADSRVKIML